MGFAPFGSVVEGMDVVDKIYPAYGESPRQDLITEQGDAYLKANFPKIGRIKLARIVPAVPPATHARGGGQTSGQAFSRSGRQSSPAIGAAIASHRSFDLQVQRATDGEREDNGSPIV
jgi:hypothetical protein